MYGHLTICNCLIQPAAFWLVEKLTVDQQQHVQERKNLSTSGDWSIYYNLWCSSIIEYLLEDLRISVSTETPSVSDAGGGRLDNW